MDLRKSTLTAVLCLFLIEPSVIAMPLPSAPTHAQTHWDLRPSMEFDALCLLNVLSGDPYYLEYYRPEFEHFHPLFNAEENDAFAELKRVIKDEGHGIVSAQLTLYYSVLPDEDLPQMITTAQDSTLMKQSLRKTSYWNDDSWATYERARPALQTALKALLRVNFPAYWQANAKPKVEAKIQSLLPQLPEYDIVPIIENLLGFPLPSNTITVYLLAYSEPHGIRITGLRFISHFSYPFITVLHIAIHEPMHPPYNANSPAIKAAVAQLSRDQLIDDKVRHHNTSFGYNTSAGYIEEDSVQALDQIVSERVGLTRDPCRYWTRQDDGMHVLAVAIYWEYKHAIQNHPEPYSQWFVEAVSQRKLQGDHLKAAILQVLPSAGCPAAAQKSN